VQRAVLEVEDAVDLAARVVRDLGDVAARAQVEVAGLLGLGQLGDQRRPLGAGLVALEVEAVLVRGRAAVVGLGVGGVRPGGVLPVADLLAPLAKTL
jgi:hypothetical protein